MALSSSYVLRETGGNLKRNLFMTLAAIITMTVALAAVGAVFVMQDATHSAIVQSEGGVQLAIFMSPTASQNEIAAVGQELNTTPGIKRYHFVDKPQAYVEFKTLFQGNSDLINVLRPADMPTSYRVVPTNAADIGELGNQFTGQKGVMRVSYPAKEVSGLLRQFHKWQWGGFIAAVLVLVGAVALIVNTIQLAIYARRREVSVMKLVGATNWFIRVPFMIEGLVHGLAGAAIAFGLVYEVRNGIAGFLPQQSFLANAPLIVTSWQGIVAGIYLLLIGAAVGVLGSAFAVRRYLAV